MVPHLSGKLKKKKKEDEDLKSKHLVYALKLMRQTGTYFKQKRSGFGYLVYEPAADQKQELWE